MVSFGIFLSFLTGFVTVNLISLKFSLIEKLGLSFPIGIALQTLLMLLMDAVGIPLTRVSILVASVLLILSLSFPMIFRRKELVQEIRKPVSFDFSGFKPGMAAVCSPHYHFGIYEFLSVCLFPYL